MLLTSCLSNNLFRNYVQNVNNSFGQNVAKFFFLTLCLTPFVFTLGWALEVLEKNILKVK